MKITFLSDEGSWKNPSIATLASRLRQKRHSVRMLHKTAPVPQGDILFILGFFQIVKPAHRYGVRRNDSAVVMMSSASGVEAGAGAG